MRSLALSLLAVLFACSPPEPAAEPQPESPLAPYVSGISAIQEGGISLCIRAFEIAAVQRGEGANAILLRQSGWRAAGSTPPGDVPFTDARTAYAQAPLPDGATERVFAAFSISDRPHCSIIAYGGPVVARELIERFGADPNLTRLSIRAGSNAGIDMFGLPYDNPAADFGVTVYTPNTALARDRGIGALA